MSTGGPYSKKRKTGDGPDEERIPGVYNPDNAAVAQQIQDTLGNAPREPSQRMPIGGKSGYSDQAAGGAPDMSGIPDAPPDQQPSAPAGAQSGENYDQLLDRSPDPTQPDQRGDRRRGGGFGIQEGGSDWRLTNQDYNPNGYRPNESRSTGVGKYQGSPLFEATIGAPHSVIGAKLATNARKREELNKALQSFDPYAGIEDVNAPEYRDSFQRGVMNDIQDYMDSVHSLYGEEEGNRRMMQPSTAEGRALRQKGMHWTTISRNINQATKASDAIIQGARSGTLEVSPELYKQAEELRHKLGDRAGVDDPEELAKSMVVFNANVSLVDQLAKDKVLDVMKEAGSVQKVYELAKKGSPQFDRRFSTLVGKKTLDNDAIVDSLTDHYYRQYQGDLTKDQVRTMIASMAPQLNEQDIVRTQYHKPSSKGSGGDGTKARQESAMYSPDATALPESLDFNDNTRGTFRPTVNLLGFSNNQGKEAAPLSFRDGNVTHFMHPERLMDVNGDVMIIGKETGMPRTAAEKEEAASTLNLTLDGLDAALKEAESTGMSKQDMIERFGVLKDVMVPLSGQNENLLVSALGIDMPRALEAMGHTGRQSRAAARPMKQEAKSNAAPAFVIQKGYTQADWDALTDEQRKKLIAKGKL